MGDFKFFNHEQTMFDTFLSLQFWLNAIKSVPLPCTMGIL